MKNLFLVGLLLQLFTMLYAQGLNSNASYIKNNYALEYEQTIKKNALDEWGNNYMMVIYYINTQADALSALLKEFTSDNTNIAFNAIQNWSIDGYLSKNIALFKQMEVFNLQNLLKMNCNWMMVKYEYENQVNAKNSF